MKMSEKIEFKNDTAEFYFQADDEVIVQDLPEKLYHFTSVKNEKSIDDDGLKCSDTTGNIYFCDSPDALDIFMDLNHTLTRETSFLIYEVETNNPFFDIKYLRKSNDSPFPAYAYYKDIVWGVEQYGIAYMDVNSTSEI